MWGVNVTSWKTDSGLSSTHSNSHVTTYWSPIIHLNLPNRASKGITLPEFGQYATGILYLDQNTHVEAEKDFETLAASLGISIIAWRDVPVDSSAIGVVARKSEPISRQVFLSADNLDKDTLKRQIFVLRKRATHECSKEGRRFYICSLSTLTIVYKGLFNSDQLWVYYTDLLNPEFDTYLALVHTRFSTNTFPSWERAHPLRVLAHNGEINTLRGNVNFMKAREGVMKSEVFGAGEKFKIWLINYVSWLCSLLFNLDLKKLYPVVEPNLSDSGSADCCLEFLAMAGKRSLPEVKFKFTIN